MKVKVITVLFTLISIAAIAQKKTKKKSTDILAGASFHFVLDYKGHKEFFSTQYQNHEGLLYPAAPNGKLSIFYTAGNDKNDDRFSVSGDITAAEKRAFTFDDHAANLSLMISNYPEVSAFVLTGGNITITAMPLKVGLVKGTFTGSGWTLDGAGQKQDYRLTGDFSLTRM